MTRSFALVVTLMLLSVAAPEARALNNWQKKSVMNHTGQCAKPVWGFGACPETWGWFGVRYWSGSSYHHGYYGDYKQWGYRQGY